MPVPLVFVDIDTQFDFIDPKGALPIPGGDALIPTLQRLTRFAEDNDIPILASLDTHLPDDPEYKIFGFPPHCLPGTPGHAKIPATVGRTTETFTKGTFDVFSSLAFRRRFAELEPREIVVYGVAQDWCVRGAALSLAQTRRPLWIVEDAVAGAQSDRIERTWKLLEIEGARKLTAEGVLRRFDRVTRSASGAGKP
jgi:nicotinamidase/pyrazinamidase